MMRTEDDNKYSTFYGYVPHMQNDIEQVQRSFTHLHFYRNLQKESTCQNLTTRLC